MVRPATTEEAPSQDTSTASTAAASAAQPAPTAAGVPTAFSAAGQKAQSGQSRATTSPLSELEATPTSAQIGDPSLYAEQEPATPETEKNDADRLGKGLLFLLSAENLVGYESRWHTITPTQYQGTSFSGVEGSTDSKLFTLFGGHGTGGTSPQLALDRTIVPCFTIGAVFGYSSNDGGETKWTGVSTPPRKNGTSSSYAIGGRIGFLFMLDEHWGIWSKVGLTYWSLSQTTYSYPDPSSSSSSSETINEVDQHAVLLTPAVTLVVSPVEHFAFLFGMNVPFSLGGGYSYQVNGVTVHEGDLSTGALGLSAGLLGYL